MNTWRQWTDDDLDAARDEIIAAYRAMLALIDAYDDLPFDVHEGYHMLQNVVSRLEAIDRKRLAAWNKAMAVKR